MFGKDGKGTSLMGWFSAYLYTKYNISNHKHQSTYADALIMLAEQEMKFIQINHHVLLSDEGFLGHFMLVCGSNWWAKDCIWKEYNI